MSLGASQGFERGSESAPCGSADKICPGSGLPEELLLFPLGLWGRDQTGTEREGL